MRLVGIEVKLHFHYLESLKAKRRIIKSILDKTRHKFHVSSAEVGQQDSLIESILGFAVVSNEFVHAEKNLQQVINYIDQVSEVEIISVEWLEA